MISAAGVAEEFAGLLDELVRAIDAFEVALLDERAASSAWAELCAARQRVAHARDDLLMARLRALATLASGEPLAGGEVPPSPMGDSSTVTGPVCRTPLATGPGTVDPRRVIVRVRRGADRMFVKQLSEHSRTFTPEPSQATTYELADTAAVEVLLGELREAKCFEPELIDAGALQ